MQLKFCVSSVVLAFALLSCRPAIMAGTPTPDIPVQFGPHPSGWAMVGPTPWIVIEHHQIAILAIVLSNQRSTLIYSAPSKWVEQIKRDGIVQLTDDIENRFLLQDIWPVATLDDLELGVLNFQARSENSRRLVLQIGLGKEADNLAELLVAQSNDDPPWNIQSRQSSAFSEALGGSLASIEQNGFQITFYGWAPPAGNWPDPRPIESKPLDTALTFVLNDLQSSRQNYIYLQLYSDGTAQAKQFAK